MKNIKYFKIISHHDMYHIYKQYCMKFIYDSIICRKNINIRCKDRISLEKWIFEN
jgi:hypothetical protein